MAYYKYSEVTRDLIEISDFLLTPEDSSPVSSVEITKQDLLNLYQWNAETVSFEPKIQRVITKKDFLKRINPLEYVAIKSATVQNPIVDYYWQLFMLAEEINLDDPDTQTGLGLLSQIGLIESHRVQEIIA